MRCDPTVERYRCQQRDVAVRTGEMRWLAHAPHGVADDGLGGWVWPASPLGGAIFRWTFCPFCGERLAPPVEVR